MLRTTKILICDIHNSSVVPVVIPTTESGVVSLTPIQDK